MNTCNDYHDLFESMTVMNTIDGSPCDSRIRVVKQSIENSCAVSLTGIAGRSWEQNNNGSFNPDQGILLHMTPKNEVEGFVSVYKKCEFWCSPYFGSDLKNVPDETQLLIIKQKNGKYIVLLPVCGNKFKCVFKGGTKENEFTARIFCWKENVYSIDDLAFICGVGEDPFELIKQCVDTAIQVMESPINTIEKKPYPEIFEYLGWCSWDSMQIRVSEEGILEKCEEFKVKDVPVKWMILDDMWAYIKDFYEQSYQNDTEMIELMHRSALYDFEADPKRFPGGLKSCISKIKDYGYKAGIWYPTTGYWRGIDKYGPAYEKLKEYLIETKNGYVVPDWKRSNSYGYYAKIFEFFKKCGIDFVKIDNQSMSRRFYYGMETVGRVAEEYHGGLEAAAGEFFNGCMINCMGTSSEDIWHRTVSPVSRVSGDFQPENKEWFSKHIMQCAYASLLLGQFYYCDWDMWWTDDGQSAKNSLMRAISGGPIYVSDKLDRTRPEVLKPLAFEDGKILRCDRTCIPTEDCLVSNPLDSGKALKLQNMANNCGIMAVLNVDSNDRTVTAKISGDMINGFDSEEYVAYEYFSRTAKVLRRGENFEISLSSNEDYRLYIFVPMNDGYAPIGRIDKFITPKSIKYVHEKEMVLVEDGPYAFYDNGRLHIVDER